LTIGKREPNAIRKPSLMKGQSELASKTGKLDLNFCHATRSSIYDRDSKSSPDRPELRHSTPQTMTRPGEDSGFKTASGRGGGRTQNAPCDMKWLVGKRSGERGQGGPNRKSRSRIRDWRWLSVKNAIRDWRPAAIRLGFTKN
jgi:hypothetical protein